MTTQAEALAAINEYKDELLAYTVEDLIEAWDSETADEDWLYAFDETGIAISDVDLFYDALVDTYGQSNSGLAKSLYTAFTEMVKKYFQGGTDWGSDANAEPPPDPIIGNDTDETLTGGDGNDSITGGGGNDTIVVPDGNNTVDGGTGNDTIEAGGGNDTISGGEGNDSIEAGEGNDSVLGGLGDDVIDAGIGNNSVEGGEGNDTIVAAEGKDTIQGGAGNDSIDSGAGNDTLIGGDGDDTLSGGVGGDSMQGGEGGDTYYVDSTKDKVTEVANTAPASQESETQPVDIGSSIDSVIASIKYTLNNYVENLTLTGTGNLAGTGNTENNTLTGNAGNNNLNGKTGNDSLDGGAGNDGLTGDVGNDTLVGGDGNDKLTAGVGDDSLDGGTGNDTLKGDVGADTLIGGSGADKLTGGAGADMFVFAYLNTTDADADAVSDFTEEDVLRLDSTVFTQLFGATSENLAIDKLAENLESNDYLIYDSKKGILYYDADGSGTSSTAVKIVALKGTDAKTTFAFDDLNIA